MHRFAGRDGGNVQNAGHLIRQILSRYHSAHRRDLPRLCALARKVESHHADNPNAPHGLTDLLQRIWRELEAHMRREEQILFPSMLRKAKCSQTEAERMPARTMAAISDHWQRLSHLAREFARAG